MKFFTNKKFLFKFIAVLCILFAFFNFIYPPKSQAESLLAAAGGKLLDPIVDLVLVIGDGVMEVFQITIMGREASAMYDNTKATWWETALKVLTFATVFVAVCALTAGIGAIAACIPLIGGVIASGITSGIVVGAVTLIAYSAVSGSFFEEVVVLPTYYIGPEEIFSGKILLFDVNIFNSKELQVSLATVDNDGNITNETTLSSEEWKEQKQTGQGAEIQGGYIEQYYFYYDNNGEMVKTSVNSTAQDMKEIIARWYYLIRNIAIIGLLLVLVYVGIRMLLTSISSEKAKYKQMIGDWVIALCLIFLMQYIMVFANEFVEGVTQILASATEVHGQVAVITDPPDKLVEAIGEETEIDGTKIIQDGNINWPTNLMGRMRILAQQKDGTSGYIGYAICFIVLVMFTIFFVFTYLKRLLYILFLTFIAPFVAMTYPIDKLRDGKAQAFEMWMKEYTCNLLIQPFHLLLYTIFVTMAFELAGSNIVYSLVVLGFMMPAERFLRKMFGFDRASTPGFLDGAAGAAMTMTAINSLTKFGKRGAGSEKNGSNKRNSENGDNGFLNRGQSRNVQDLINNMAGSGESSDENNQQQDTQQLNNNNNEEQPQQSDRDNRNEQNRRRVLNPEDEEERKLREELNSADYNDMYLDPDSYLQKQDRLTELERLRLEDDMQNEQVEEQQPEGEQPQEEPEIEPQTSFEKLPRSEVAKAALRRTFVTPAKRGKSNIKKNFKRNFKASAANGARFAAKFTGAGIAGIAGLSAGIAAGDPSDVARNTAAGVVAGQALGSGISNSAISGVQRISSTAGRFKEDTLKEAYGANYSEYQKYLKDEKFKKDQEIRELYARELNLKTKEEIDAVMRDAVKYREYGVEDNETIIKAMSMDNGNKENRANIERIGAARLSMNSKSLKDLDTTMKRFSKTPGISKEQIKQMENRIKFINNL